jgi:UDP-glucuronate 4-epimerase
LLNQGLTIHGLDNLNDYYDPKLKQDRLQLLCIHPSFFSPAWT